jgi:polysaccharide export outer membrane protein
MEANPDVVMALRDAHRPPMLLEAGDLVEIQVFEIEKFDFKARVDSDGHISVPLVGNIGVRGLDSGTVEKLIAEKLAAREMVYDPHVLVTIVEQPSQIVTVSGQVLHPGVFPALGQQTIQGAIALAGGFTDTASRTVTLIRSSTQQAYVLDLGSNAAKSVAAAIPVFGGDTVVVSTVGVIYVVGAVKTPGVYKLKTSSPTTVIEAVAAAGGAGYEAMLQDAWLIHTQDGTRYLAPLDINQMIKGKASDPALQADDIVFIPTSKMKAALKGGAASLIGGIAAAAIYRF